MTKHFSKWVAKQKISTNELLKTLEELENGGFEANLGGHIFKKRIRFQGKGKSGSGRTIICYEQDEKMVFIHGFSKNEKSNLTPKELIAFKEFAKILLALSPNAVNIAIKSGDFIEVK
ncbi:MAG: type II toxin-antitoxin system RelE/ParE family toxin [Bacteroidales bacterium]|nr:type II toxin-antitoxin system RelE/ParE family toxin [Bacteroidales bacterium]